MQSTTKSGTSRLSQQATGVVKRSQISPLRVTDTPRTGESLLKRQQASSLFTGINSRSVKSNNRKGSTKKKGNKKRKSSNYSSLYSQQTTSEENSFRLDSDQLESSEKNSAAEDEISVENCEKFIPKECSKSQALQKKTKNVMNRSEDKASKDVIINSSRIDSLKVTMNETTSNTEASHVDKKNCPHTLQSKSKDHTTDSANFLFSKIKTPKRETQKAEGENSFVPESQEDKTDNVFSPRLWKKKPKSASLILERRENSVTDLSAQSVKGRKTVRGTEEKTNGSLALSNSDKKVVRTQSKENLTTNKRGGDGAVATVGSTSSDTKQDCDMSLSDTPISNGLIKRIASSTPLITSEAQSIKSPALPLTPGSDIPTSVLNFMMNSGLNTSSDLFNETDLKDSQESLKDTQEISEISDDMETKDFRRGYQDMTKSSNRMNVSTNQQKNEISNIRNSDNICIPECQKLKNPMNIEKNYDHHKVETHLSDVLDQKNCSLTKINILKFEETFQNKLDKEDFVLTDSQRNGLMITMISQDSSCPSRPPDNQREIDIKLKGDDDSGCDKNNIGCHKKPDKLHRENKVMEIYDGEFLEAGKKRKLQQDADPDVPCKRMCGSHGKNSNQISCKAEDVKKSTSHVTLKTDLNTPTRKAQDKDEGPGNFTFSEKLMDMSDLSFNYVEGKDTLESSLSGIANKEDILNQAVQDVSELGYKNNNSLFSQENKESPSKSVNLREYIEAVSEYEKPGTGTSKDISASESFLEEAFGSWPQGDVGQQTTVQESINQDSQPMGDKPSVLLFLNDTDNQKENEERVNDIQNCDTVPFKPVERKEVPVNSRKSSAAVSSKGLNDTFSQLEITLRTEALLEGKHVINCRKRLSDDLFYSPTEKCEEVQENRSNKVGKKENTGISESKRSFKSTSPSKEVVMALPITNNEADKKGNNMIKGNSTKNHTDNVKSKELKTAAHEESGHSISQIKTERLGNIRKQQHDVNSASDLSSAANNSLPSTSSFCIIDVVNDSHVFASFLEELKQQTVVSVALACENAPSQRQKQERGIGEIFSYFGS